MIQEISPQKYDNTYDKLIDSVPQVLDTIKNLIKDISPNKNKRNSDNSSCKTEETHASYGDETTPE